MRPRQSINQSISESVNQSFERAAQAATEREGERERERSHRRNAVVADEEQIDDPASAGFSKTSPRRKARKGEKEKKQDSSPRLERPAKPCFHTF